MEEAPPARRSAPRGCDRGRSCAAYTFLVNQPDEMEQKANVERPEYPKLVALAGTAKQARDLLPTLLGSDPDAALVDGGARGVYARVHNEAAEAAARQHGESRSFPLA